MSELVEQADLAPRVEAHLRDDCFAGDKGRPKGVLWLGHANLTTTEVYIRGDPTDKLEAIEAIVPPHLRKGSFRPPDKLIAMLRDRS